MRSINAVSIAPDARNWLTNSRYPLILHVFDQVCNLINERRDVLSIVTQPISNGPFNLVVKEDVLFSDHLHARSPISIRANQLRLGDLTISTVNAKPWSPRPDWERLHTKRDAVLNQLMSLPGARFATRQSPHGGGDCFGWKNTTLATTLAFTNYQSPTLRQDQSNITNSLISSLVNADLPSSLAATQQLAGLGVGLTPAGDDFIVGAVLAAWIIHPPEIAGVLAEGITSNAAPLTTSLSAAWLRSAGRGGAGILWHDFFDALSIGDSSAIQLQITKLLSVGHTSGADALAGFIGTFISYAESGTKLCHS